MASVGQARTQRPPYSAVAERPAMPAAVSVTAKLLGSAALLFCISGLAQHFHITGYAYLAYSLVGSLVIYLWTRPRTASLAGTVIVGTGFAIVYAILKQEPVLNSALAFLGLGCLATLGLEAIWGIQSQREAQLDTALTAAMFPMFLITSGFCLGMTTAFHPRTLDLYLYAFDARLGVQPSFLAGRLFAWSHALRLVCYYSYESLPLAMAIAFALERSRRGSRTSNIVIAFTAAAAGGFIAYNILPAVGPIHIFGKQFPFAPPMAGVVPFQTVPVESAPRNAMPSVHIAMALLIFWNSRRWGRVWNSLAAALVCATILATLGFGEHYLVDLCVAVPFALAAQSLATSGLTWRTPERILAMLLGTGSVLAWLLYLRLPAPPFAGTGGLAWIALFGTVAASLVAEWRLNRRSHNVQPA